jgi:hypothetical protein
MAYGNPHQANNGPILTPSPKFRLERARMIDRGGLPGLRGTLLCVEVIITFEPRTDHPRTPPHWLGVRKQTAA